MSHDRLRPSWHLTHARLLVFSGLGVSWRLTAEPGLAVPGRQREQCAEEGTDVTSTLPEPTAASSGAIPPVQTPRATFRQTLRFQQRPKSISGPVHRSQLDGHPAAATSCARCRHGGDENQHRAILGCSHVEICCQHLNSAGDDTLHEPLPAQCNITTCEPFHGSVTVRHD